jgi:hypothetical protein
MSSYENLIGEFGLGTFFVFFAYRVFFDTERTVKGFMMNQPFYKKSESEGLEVFPTIILGVIAAGFFCVSWLVFYDVLIKTISSAGQIRIQDVLKTNIPTHLNLVEDWGAAILLTWSGGGFLYNIYFRKTQDESFDLLFYPEKKCGRQATRIYLTLLLLPVFIIGLSKIFKIIYYYLH